MNKVLRRTPSKVRCGDTAPAASPGRTVRKPGTQPSGRAWDREATWKCLQGTPALPCTSCAALPTPPCLSFLLCICKNNAYPALSSGRPGQTIHPLCPGPSPRAPPDQLGAPAQGQCGARMTADTRSVPSAGQALPVTSPLVLTQSNTNHPAPAKARVAHPWPQATPVTQNPPTPATITTAETHLRPRPATPPAL